MASTVTLNSQTIPSPQDMQMETIETSVELDTITGKTRRQVFNRKKRYTLIYNQISQNDVNTLFNILDLDTAVDFEYSDTNYSISTTSVHVFIPNENFLRGASYIERLNLILLEVE